MSLKSKIFAGLLFLVGCSSPQPTGYFHDIHDETVSGVRTVRIDVDDKSVNGTLFSGLGLTCSKPDGTEVPNWGLYHYSYGDFRSSYISQIRLWLFGTPASINTISFEQLVVHFKTPDPPSIRWPLWSHEEWEYGRWLMEQGEYDNVLCRWTIYWIEEGAVFDLDTGHWDTSTWHELESIEF